MFHSKENALFIFEGREEMVCEKDTESVYKVEGLLNCLSKVLFYIIDRNHAILVVHSYIQNYNNKN